MPYYLVGYRLKKYLFILLFFLGCETFDLKTDNPLDPLNPEYQEPTITILSPSDQQTINTDKVEIILQGNELVTEYRYRIVTSDTYFNMGDLWSDWSTSNTISIELLNEYTYTIDAQSRYLNEETSEEAAVTFEIDAVNPSSLLLYPKYVETTTNNIFNIFLYAHDLSNVSALEFVIEIDPSKISFLPDNSKEYSDVNVVKYDEGSDKVYYTLGIYNKQTGFEKDQLIANPYFLTKSASFNTSYITILSASAKSFDGETIEIVETSQTKVVILE
mgnify:FL=1